MGGRDSLYFINEGGVNSMVGFGLAAGGANELGRLVSIYRVNEKTMQGKKQTSNEFQFATTVLR